MPHKGSRTWEAPLGDQELISAETSRAQADPAAGLGIRSGGHMHGGLWSLSCLFSSNRR